METLWTWDNQKALLNAQKHGVSFELARLVFYDPYLISIPDPHESDERWRTLGMVGQVVLFVVHTAPEPDETVGREIGRIISARKATPLERQAYANG